MSEGKIAISADMHRQLGVDLFNSTWDLIEKSDRTKEDVDAMIHGAHASAYHWRHVGEPLNFARSEWQISRVYAILDLPEAAHYHARRCLEIIEEEGIGDFDLAFAYEAIARAAAIAGNKDRRNRYMEMAERAGKQIKKKGDREYFFAELATVQAAG